jgi:hypothetical protein
MSGFTTAGFENTPDIYLTNQEVGRFSELDDAAITYKLHQYGSVLMQHGINPRAFAGIERILAHLTFEQQYRAGTYDEVIAAYRGREAAEAAAEQVTEAAPVSLALRRTE